MPRFSHAASSFGADDVVGGYELLRQIGKGGMAEVWVARKQNSKSKYVAIKVILPHLAGDERITRMFASEANLSSQLSHSNIVQVFDIGSDNGIEYLVMEWVDGTNLVALREALNDVALEERYEIASFVVGQLLHALSYAHSITTHEGEGLAIVHRDVSPQNILVSNAGDVKLTDFGVAHTAIDESSGLHIKGKIRYMSPEQMAGHTRQCTIDLYAAGAILHELVTAKRFRGEIDDSRVLHGQILGGVIPPMPLALPPELEKVRLALLNPDDKERVQTAEAALEMLSEFRGYRDKRRALSKMCGALTGILRPRTGPGEGRATPAPGSAASTPVPPGPATEHLGQQLVASGPGTPITAPTTLLDAPAGPMAATLTNGQPAPSVAGQVPTSAGSRHSGKVFLLLGVVMVLAFGGTLGTAWWIWGSGEPAAADSIAAAQPAAAADPATATAPVAAAAPASPPDDALIIPEPLPEQPAATVEPAAHAPAAEAAAPTPAEAEPAPEALPTPTGEPESTPAQTPKPQTKPRSGSKRSKGSKAGKSAASEPSAAKGAPVLVHLRLNKVSEGWVKIGGKTLKIKGGSSVRIPSGRHSVYKKHAEDDPFSKCGTLNLAPGKEWKLFVGPTHCKAVAFGS